MRKGDCGKNERENCVMMERETYSIAEEEVSVFKHVQTLEFLGTSVGLHVQLFVSDDPCPLPCDLLALAWTPIIATMPDRLKTRHESRPTTEALGKLPICAVAACNRRVVAFRIHNSLNTSPHRLLDG